MRKVTPILRLLESTDIPEIVEAFQHLGWNKSASQYERYLTEQSLPIRDVYVASVEGKLAGYLTIGWTSSDEPFKKENIPEIADFNVLPEYRRRGLARL